MFINTPFILASSSKSRRKITEWNAKITLIQEFLPPKSIKSYVVKDINRKSTQYCRMILKSSDFQHHVFWLDRNPTEFVLHAPIESMSLV